ncbi:hypothetical protein [Parasitella parasitica]|uniref:Uncharacterized protein n=1 Tax=Parasitella parasitica TaxID=35722 RepID=A0A0B7NQY2_9FUNG|nr:hypothetical protein [Parasitella parasitica]
MNATTRKQTNTPRHNPGKSSTLLTKLSNQKQRQNSSDGLPLFLLEEHGPPHPTESKSVDHSSSKQEKYNQIESRLFALEESEKWFEDRLHQLEECKNDILLRLQQPMKPNQQQMHQQHDSGNPHDAVDDGNYKDLYHSLLEKYDRVQNELKDKELYYQQQIKRLVENQKLAEKEEVEAYRQPNVRAEKQHRMREQKEAFREENGYIIFYSTGVDGNVVEYKVKIPTQSLPNTPPTSIASSPNNRLNPKAKIYEPNPRVYIQ